MSGTGKEQGEPVEGEKSGLPAVEMKKGAASVPSSLVTVWQISGCLWVPDCQSAGGIGSRQSVGIASYAMSTARLRSFIMPSQV